MVKKNENDFNSILVFKNENLSSLITKLLSIKIIKPIKIVENNNFVFFKF